MAGPKAAASGDDGAARGDADGAAAGALCPSMAILTIMAGLNHYCACTYYA